MGIQSLVLETMKFSLVTSGLLTNRTLLRKLEINLETQFHLNFLNQYYRQSVRYVVQPGVFHQKCI